MLTGLSTMSDETRPNLQVLDGGVMTDAARPMSVCRAFECARAATAEGLCNEHILERDDKRSHFELARSLMIADALKRMPNSKLTFEQKRRQAEVVVDEFLVRIFEESDRRLSA